MNTGWRYRSATKSLTNTMSFPINCHCPERSKPPAKRNWAVTQRRSNRSAFNGYHETYSDYSAIVCLSCGHGGRTKAAYVDELPNARLNKQGRWEKAI